MIFPFHGFSADQEWAILAEFPNCVFAFQGSHGKYQPPPHTHNRFIIQGDPKINGRLNESVNSEIHQISEFPDLFNRPFFFLGHPVYWYQPQVETNIISLASRRGGGYLPRQSCRINERSGNGGRFHPG